MHNTRKRSFFSFSTQLTTFNTIIVPCILYLALPSDFNSSTGTGERAVFIQLSSSWPSSFNYLAGAGRPALYSDTCPGLSERETDTVSRQEARLWNLGHSGILYDMVTHTHTHTHTHSAGISCSCKRQVWMCFLKRGRRAHLIKGRSHIFFPPLSVWRCETLTASDELLMGMFYLRRKWNICLYR